MSEAPASTTRVYAIVDASAVEAIGERPLEFARRLLVARPAMLQFRAKHWPKSEILSVARELKGLCDGTDTRFWVNDHPEIADAVGAEGVHVGQGDLPVREVVAAYPALGVGVSTHSLEQMKLALAVGSAVAPVLRYVAFGPVFPTRSKLNPELSVGLAQLEAAHSLARERGVPLVAIGGVERSNVAAVAQWAEFVAVIGAIVAPDCASRLRALEVEMARPVDDKRGAP